jgi:hypothetical protein
MSLIAGGGVFIALVFAYNKWQEYKARKSVERAFAGEHDDVLMRPERQEPGFHDSHDIPGQPGHPGHHYGEDPHATADIHGDKHGGAHGHHHGAHHVAERADAIPPQPLPPHTVPGLNARQRDAMPIDGLIDCVIPMMLENPVAGSSLLPALLALRHVGNKPLHFAGMAVGEWESLAPDGQYSQIRIGVQMASRSSALNELEYSELVMRLRQLADSLGAEVEVPDMIDVMARARSLHQFVAEHDAQLGVNVHSNGAPWAINTLLVALEKQGFDLRPDGRFVMPDAEGAYLFSLSTNVTPAAETTSRLTLLLDVPCVAPDKDGFGTMIDCAKALVTRLEGTIVDDSNTPLQDDALGQIAGQVQSFYEEMQTCQIPAGSSRALRLFS